MLSAGSKNELVIKLFRVKPAANFCGRLIVLLFRAYKSGAENFSLQTKRIESEGFTFVRTTCDEIQKSGRGSNERPDVSPLAFSDSILFNAEAAHSALGRPLEPPPQHVFSGSSSCSRSQTTSSFCRPFLSSRCCPDPSQALACALGINCGVAVHTIAAILGISAVIAGSAELFAVLKWAGAAYLFYLGLRSLLASRRHESHEDGAPIEAAAAALQNAEAETPAAAFRSGLFCNLLNPKVVLFVLTFFPQFMDAALPAGPQLALMGVTWAFLGLAWLAVLVVMMDRIRPVFGRPAFQRWLNRTMSVILILFGLRLAAARS